MKITDNSPKPMIFKDLTEGDVFKYEHSGILGLYMKVSDGGWSDKTTNALELNEAYTTYFTDNTEVIKVNAELIIR